MKINNSRGDRTDILAVTKPLVVTSMIMSSVCTTMHIDVIQAYSLADTSINLFTCKLDFRSRPVFLFQPVCRLDHPECYLLS